ncbi:MAG: AMP-binding protein [Labilithrix sp.]|nr:AMP-binding protein [Labilithrix sp.]
MDHPPGMEAFWERAARAVDWAEPWDRVLDCDRPPFARWFVGGKLNTCHNAVDRHVDAGHGDRVAFIYDSPLAGEQRRITYRELRDQVAKLAGALRSLGVRRGDRVVIYMPMIPETAMAMLACARLGAVHSVVFGGFAPAQLAARVDDAEPKVVICASAGLEPQRIVPYKELVDQALSMARHRPARCVVLQRKEHRATLHAPRDVDWSEVVEDAEPAPCVMVDATDPLYVLYTSGTTGHPKGIVRDNGGHAVMLAHTMDRIYRVQPGEVWWTASDFGWVVGHSYIVYGPLLRGATSIIYEGKPVGTPDAGAFFRVIAEHGVVSMFTAPTAYRGIRRADPEGELLAGKDLSRLRAVFLAGERCDPDTLVWARRLLGVPVIDHWWQTETGAPITASPPGEVPVREGSAGIVMPGFDLQVLDAQGAEVPRGTVGTLAIRLPLPPGCLPTLWNDDARFVKSYLSDFAGYYTTSDAGYVDADGYVFVMSRTDDIINVAGHRLSTGEMEEVVASHPAVAESAVIGVRDELKGEVPMGILVLKQGAPTDGVAEEVIARVRERVGPVASFKRVVVVPALPKTRSGKTLRRTLRLMANGDPWEVPATTEDAGALDALAPLLIPERR